MSKHLLTHGFIYFFIEHHLLIPFRFQTRQHELKVTLMSNTESLTQKHHVDKTDLQSDLERQRKTKPEVFYRK